MWNEWEKVREGGVSGAEGKKGGGHGLNVLRKAKRYSSNKWEQEARSQGTIIGGQEES